MAVRDIEIYDDVAKIILKPTKKFPNGYFYTDNNPVAINLVESYCWLLTKHDNNTYIIAKVGTRCTGQKLLRFHKEYKERLHNTHSDYIDHVDGLGINNRDCNLNIVTHQQNIRNKPSVGYLFGRNNCFLPKYTLDGNQNFRGSYRFEHEALLAIAKLRQEVYSDYDYDFYLDRRNDKDLLDLELTSQISSKEATYLHVKRHVDNNPWYVYRYNLFDYCNQSNIVIPDFALDSQGFMINPVTKKRLCPY